MVLCNYATMTVTAKIVYYGPGLGGKTTNLNYLYKRSSPDLRGEMVSLTTETERTLFFDLLPINAGPIGDFKARVQLYTVPGQIHYQPMRKIVLEGADGIVFVADSQASMGQSNRDSFADLVANLEALDSSLDEIALVLQYNKRDLRGVLSVDDLHSILNPERKYPWFEASALHGPGVFPTLEAISKLAFRAYRQRLLGPRPVTAPVAAPPRPATPKAVTRRARPQPPAVADKPADEWEVTFEEAEETSSPPPPEPEEVRVRFEKDLGRELDKLRREVDRRPPPPPPKEGSKKAAPSIEELLGMKVGRARELNRRFDLSVPRKDLKRLRRVVLALRPEDSSQQSLGGGQEYAVDLEDPEVDGLLLSLKIHLKGQ